MISDWSGKITPTKSTPKPSLPAKFAIVLYWLASRFFAGEAMSESVATRAHCNANAETVWDHILFYEEIPGPTPLILRALLTCPIRTEGDKGRVGTMVHCKYVGGHLVKRISGVDAPHCLQFDVIEQRLGIEDCILARGGSYQIYTRDDAVYIKLVTKYHAFLYPRFVWRLLETLLVRQLHNHILRSIRSAVIAVDPALRPAPASLEPKCVTSGGLSCAVSQSSSRR